VDINRVSVVSQLASSGSPFLLRRFELLMPKRTPCNLPNAWRGDAAIFAELLERMGNELADWQLEAAAEALDALVGRLFEDCRESRGATVSTWERVALLATLLGYREVLLALRGNAQPITDRLARHSAKLQESNQGV